MISIQFGPAAFCGSDIPPWERAYSEGIRALARGELELAIKELDVAAGLNPWHQDATEQLLRAREALSSRHLELGQSYLEKGRTPRALREFVAAARLEPDSKAARILFRLGLRLYGDEWLYREDIVSREKTEDHRARRRAAELKLSPSMRLERLRAFRVWTDHRSGALVPFTTRLLRLLEDEERLYRRLFAPLALDPSRGGVDVIIFDKRRDYEEYTGHKGSAGIFLPEPEVSCFYLPDEHDEESRESFVREVFLHEVSHQLDVRVLGMRYPPRWLQEGLAVTFESARFSREGRLIGVDGPPPSSVARSLGRCGPGKEGWWGLEELSRADAATVLSRKGEWLHQYYCQSWSLVHFLLNEGPESRTIFFDLIGAYRELKGPPESPDGGFLRILSRHGQTMDVAESRLIRFYQRAAQEEVR